MALRGKAWAVAPGATGGGGLIVMSLAEADSANTRVCMDISVLTPSPQQRGHCCSSSGSLVRFYSHLQWWLCAHCSKGGWRAESSLIQQLLLVSSTRFYSVAQAGPSQSSCLLLLRAEFYLISMCT